MAFDITDDRIFCNDAGDDEDLELLNYYFFERQEFNRFYERNALFKIVKARKGTGKSALLRRTETLARNQFSGDLFVTCKGAELSPDFSDEKNKKNPILAWQKAICARINRFLGSQLSLALSDENIMLVEAAEIDNFRGRNLVSSLFDRFSVKGIDVSRQRLPITNDTEFLKRISENKPINTWLIIDDIDAKFENSDENRAALAAFFSACRDLVQKVHGLVIRCAVRTDVWHILRNSDESLDKCEQYVFNLRWGVNDVSAILLNKIWSYFSLVEKNSIAFRSNNPEIQKIQAFLVVFPQKYPWGSSGMIDSQKYLSLYSQGRPRWTAKLCRAAAEKSYRRGHDKVEERDVRDVLSAYSAARRSDIVGEHSHEYPQFNVMCQIFSQWKRRFTTQELLSRIANNHLKLHTIGEGDRADPIYLAHLLFRAGLINGVKAGVKRPEYVEFEDRPNLLTSRGNLDEGCLWEVPMYLRTQFGV